MGGVSPYDSGLPRIFINGKDADVRPSEKPMPTVFAGGKAWIGNSGKNGDRPFEGCLGNVTYETRRMSDEEIADLAQVSPDGTRPKEIVKPCHDELHPRPYFHHYFVDNNRRAAWNLIQAINGKEPLVAGIDSAIGALEMITGAYQSALQRSVVEFPLKDRRHPLNNS